MGAHGHHQELESSSPFAPVRPVIAYLGCTSTLARKAVFWTTCYLRVMATKEMQQMFE